MSALVARHCRHFRRAKLTISLKPTINYCQVCRQDCSMNSENTPLPIQIQKDIITMIKSHAINVQLFLANLLIVCMNELNEAGTCMCVCRKDMRHTHMLHVLATRVIHVCLCNTHRVIHACPCDSQYLHVSPFKLEQ